MESSESRRQSDTLPSMAYMEFERVTREGVQFHQRHSSINRASISTASPISPTTFGPPPPLSFPQPSISTSNGYNSPPDSRRTSGNEEGRQTLPSLEGRQSLPSLQEALYDKLEKPSFPAPSPMQTPPLGPGSFSSAHTHSMSRNQPPEALPSVQALPLSGSSQMYSHHPSPPLPPPPPSQSVAGPSPPHNHEYPRRSSQEHSRTLLPNPYAQEQPPLAIPPIRSSESYPPSSNGNSSYQQPHPHPHPHTYPPPPHHSTSPQYPPTPSYQNGNGVPAQQYPFPQHPSGSHPHPHPHPHPYHQPSYQQHQQPSVHSSSSYPYPSRDQGYHEPPQTSPGSKGGLKRSSRYGFKIERALSASALRRDFDTIKDVSARLYHFVVKYQDAWQGPQAYPEGLEHCSLDFAEALECSIRSTEALRSCQQVIQELSAQEFAEQSAQKMNTNHSSEYGGDDHGYAEDTRSNGSQQPDAKKIRRGRAAPPGRCHSCHRAETPEWRRGPDGARTLCNACGLHYAKLTRKLSKNPVGAGGGRIAGGKAPNSPLP